MEEYEKLEGADPAPQKDVSSKWDNFWFHHKWKVIAAAFVAVVVLIGAVQILTNKELDIRFLYAGPHVFVGDAESSVMRAFSYVMPETAGGKKAEGDIECYTILSDEQLAEMRRQAQEDGEGTVVWDPSLRRGYFEQIGTLMATGEVYVCLMDPYVYANYDREAFMTLEEALGYVPDSAEDECAARLKDTAFGKYFTAFDGLPDDTLVCMRRRAFITGSRSEKKADAQYAYSLNVFRNIFSFSPKGGTEE